jgi:peptidyl-prolyl cis-trans isomerase B (cyclophilin B)
MRGSRLARGAVTVPLVLLAAACGSTTTGGTATGTTAASPSSVAPSSVGAAVTATSAAPTSVAPTLADGRVACDWAPSTGDSGDRKPGLPPADATTKGIATVTMKTNQGTIVFTMDRAKTPCTAASFTWLASKKYFDDTPCPRVTDPGQGLGILQCGDPAGDGSGGPGYTIPDEALTGATYPAGELAMANTGSAHSGGSQFFLLFEATTELTPTYTPFGTITQGLDVVSKIAKAGNDGSNPAGGGKPTLATTIQSFTVTG